MHTFERWNARLSTFGVLAMASFVVALVTGVLLAIPFDVRSPADSVELLEIANPAARLLRGMHGWSGNLLLLFSLLHAVEHLARGSDRLLRRGVWIRVVSVVPMLLLLMITGFILKGDAEGQLARQIVAGLLARLPWLGDEAVASLLGEAGDLQLVYVHHVATASIISWIVVIEHARRLWPSAGATVTATLLTALLAMLLPPALHDGLDPVVKGPWYFVGLQEALHWISRPGLFWLATLLLLALLIALPSLPGAWRGRSKVLLVVMLAVYTLLSVWALGFRGAGWRVVWPWSAAASDETPLGSRAPRSSLWTLSFAGASAEQVPRVLDHREGCLVCHDRVTGLSPAHDPKAIGCRSCHLGNPYTLDAEQAHDGMVRVPGNLDTAMLTCGGPKCHGAIVPRVKATMMATGVGLVSVDRFVFGEASTPDGTTTLAELGHSPADLHLKGLCASCHLGIIKHKPAPITEESRGGGCTACHLSYAKRKKRYTPKRSRAFAHPALTVQISDESCFGCHSRSGRISLNYRGWNETMLEPEQVKGRPRERWRVLEDERVLERHAVDIHHERGMACIDCHTSREAMGDGTRHLHQEEATEVSCVDCHRSRTRSDRPIIRTVAWHELDEETRRIVKLRAGGPVHRRFVLAARSGRPLSNVTLAKDGALLVTGKLNKKVYRPKAPKGACGADVSGHERLSCRSCHAAWAPQCVSCHTQFDAGGTTTDPFTGRELRGRFVEYNGEARADPPPLGIRALKGKGRRPIVPFIPGMILTLNTSRAGKVISGKPPSSADDLIGGSTIFRRLYAPAVPHTTAHKGRSCRSCHSDPLALGYGRGKLELTTDKGRVAWRFQPAFEVLPQDRLPADAWIGFRKTRTGLAATRADARPFNLEEQDRILRVGACLTCHDPALPKHKDLYRDFKRSLRGVSPRCLIPGRIAAE